MWVRTFGRLGCSLILRALAFAPGFASGAAAVFHREEDVVVNQLSDCEAGVREFDGGVGWVASVAEELDAVPPGWRVIAGRAQVEDELEAAQGSCDEVVSGAGGAFVGVVDDYYGVVGEVRDGEGDAVVLIAKRMAAVVEVGADASGTPWRGGHEVAEVHIAENDLAGRGVRVEGAAERVGGAVELREIVACEDACERIRGCGADQARAFVASYFDVNFVAGERGDGAIEESELVLGGHPGDFAEDVRERAIGGMSRAGELARVGKLGPLRTASLEESVKLHVFLFRKLESSCAQSSPIERRAHRTDQADAVWIEHLFLHVHFLQLLGFEVLL